MEIFFMPMNLGRKYKDWNHPPKARIGNYLINSLVYQLVSSALV